MNLAAVPADASMSSLVIAEITGKNHTNVMRDIRETLDQAGIGAIKFERTYRDAQNKERPHFILPRRECDLVISGYSVKYRLAIIDRWQELESKQAFQIPQTMSEALRLAADLSDQLTDVKAELCLAAPKIEFYDIVTESDTVCQMAVAAQVAKLPFGRNTLFQRLRQLGVLITGGDRHNMPKQQYVTQGLFTVNQRTVENPKSGEPIVIHTTYATPKGIAWIVAKFKGDPNAGDTAMEVAS